MTSIVVDPNAQQAALQTDPATTADESDLPEKYRGKSVKEIVEITRNLETELGRKNNEVGTLRKLTDQVLGLAQNARFAPDNQQKPEPPKVTTEDLLANPTKAVSELAKYEADERTQAIEQRQANLEAQLSLSQFRTKYPDFEQTLQTTEFQGWLGKSSYRQQLAYKAANNDFGAAEELFGLYSEIQEATRKTEPEKQKQDPVEAARQAALVKRGGSSAAGVVQTDGKKIYSRAELVEMRINKPEEYEARYASEFYPAYKEGRVR